MFKNFVAFLTETFELPGVVPYPEDGKLWTDHLRQSAFLTLANANWFAEILGESKGEWMPPSCKLLEPPAASWFELGEWHRGSVGEVWTIIDFLWPLVDGLRVAAAPADEDSDSSFYKD